MSDRPSGRWIAEIYVTGDADDVEAWFDAITANLDEPGPVQLSTAGLRPDTEEHTTP